MKIKDLSVKLGKYTFDKTIMELKGLTSIKKEYETVESAMGYGVIVVGEYMPARDMTLKARIPQKGADEMHRYYGRNTDQVLIVGDRKINIKIESVDLDRKNMYNDPVLVIEMTAPDPYFYDVSDFGKNIAGSVPLFGFPWEATVDEGLSFGYKEFNDTTIFSNDGDAPIGAKFKVEALGKVVNFKIENLKTGQYVKIIKEMAMGDVLEISTVSPKPYIKLNGENVFRDIDKLSNFFKLDMGDNYIKYSAEEGVTEMNVYMYYSAPYASGLEDLIS